MNTTLAALLVLVTVALALWTAVLALRDRPVTPPLLATFVGVELLVLVQLVIGLAAVANGDGPREGATFVAYLAGSLAVLPAGVLWSRAEGSRSSTLVLTLACVALTVMTARLLQIWQARGA